MKISTDPRRLSEEMPAPSRSGDVWIWNADKPGEPSRAPGEKCELAERLGMLASDGKGRFYVRADGYLPSLPGQKKGLFKGTRRQCFENFKARAASRD